MKFIFIHIIRFRVDNARVFQRVSMNLRLVTTGGRRVKFIRHNLKNLGSSEKTLRALVYQAGYGPDESQYDRWSNRMTSFVSICSKHVGCVLFVESVQIVTCESGERTCGCSCLKCT